MHRRAPRLGIISDLRMLMSTSMEPLRRYAPMLWVCAGAAIVVALISVGRHLHRERLWLRLLAADGTEVVKIPALMDFAANEASPLYASHCARCHGAKMTGSVAAGAPNLTDDVWLYGKGSVFDIERTLMYGIRSGLSKAHNVTDMPPFGLTGRLNDGEIRNLVQYVLQLSGRPFQSAAALDGRALYHDAAKAGCADCHGYAARGDTYYGAPDLTKNVWNGGGDAKYLYDAIYYGQHHVMPGFFGTLSLEQIRALALYVYAQSHP